MVVLGAPLYAILTLADRVHYSVLTAPSDVILSHWGYRCLPLAMTMGILALITLTVALHRAVPEYAACLRSDKR